MNHSFVFLNHGSDILDKYTLIYWIQESYNLIFVFFSVEPSERMLNCAFFCKKIR